MVDLIQYYRYGGDTHRQDPEPNTVCEKYVTPRDTVARHHDVISKRRGLPDLGEHERISPRDGLIVLQTPYRLPRLATGTTGTGTTGTGTTGTGTTGNPGIGGDGDGRVWSRYGYTDSSQLVDVSRALSQLEISPRTVCQLGVSPRIVSQEIRRSNLFYPKFQHAIISPTPRLQHPQQQGNFDSLHKSFPPLGGVQECDVEADLAAPPGARTPSPTKSASSIHWTLSPYKNLHFDRKGQGRVQGPYSREFTVTCSAPTNWLRMKWGRHKGTLV